VARQAESGRQGKWMRSLASGFARIREQRVWRETQTDPHRTVHLVSWLDPTVRGLNRRRGAIGLSSLSPKFVCRDLEIYCRRACEPHSSLIFDKANFESFTVLKDI
jgi:hypothetical protein